MKLFKKLNAEQKQALLKYPVYISLEFTLSPLSEIF